MAPCVALWLLAAAPLAAQPMVVAASAEPCLRMRAEASAGASVVACLPPGARVEVVEVSGEWARALTAGGSEGWMTLDYLVVAAPVPVSEQAPEEEPAAETSDAPQEAPREPEPERRPEPEPAAEPAADAPPAAAAPAAAESAAPPPINRITFQIPMPLEQGGGTAVGSAETVETVGERLVVASGGVEFRFREMRLQAQRVEVDRVSRDVRAEGEVILDEGPRRLTGSEMTMNLDSRTGQITNAKVFADPDIYFSGAEVEMLGNDVYNVKNGEVTSCLEDNPGWSFRTSNARVRLEGLARLRNTTMRVKGAPVFYLPYMVFPAKSERAAGLLFPNLGFSQQRGDYLGLAYFQPFGPSYDATLFLDLYSEQFYGLGTEIRYRPSETTTGWFEGYAIEDPLEEVTRWKLAWDHSSDDLPLGFRGVVRLRDFSDFDFFRDFERDFNNITIRRVESAGFLSGNWGAQSLNILVSQNEAFISSQDSVVARQLPEIEYRLRSQQLGDLPLYLDLLSSVNLISVRRGDLFDVSYSRADLYPQLTLPLSTLPWLSLSVTAGERVTIYEDSVNEELTGLGGGSLTRTFPTAGALVVGPSLSRVFNKSLGSFAKFKHIFEPRWGYSYIGDFEEQNRVPLFDEVDTLRAQNIFGYALVNRLLAKPKDEELMGGPREILSFEINQAFSLDEQQPLQRSRDGKLSTTEGPLGALLRFNPTQQLSLEARATYSTLFGNLESTSLSGGVGGDRVGVGLAWFTRYDAETGDERSDQIRLSTSFELWRDRLTFNSSVNYDVLADFVQSHGHSLIFNGQCWGFRLDYWSFRSVLREEYDFRFALSLKNIGTFLDLTGGSRGGQF